MKLILLYGPPAVGKLTIAQALSTRTGYKLFHNHLTVDAITPIFEQGSVPFKRAIDRVRLVILEEAINSNIAGVILTKVHFSSRGTYTQDFLHSVANIGAEIHLVRLYCEPDILEARVTGEDRKRYNKIWTVDLLQQTLADIEEPFAAIAGWESLSIDTGRLSPDQAANQIIAHYHLTHYSSR